MKIKNWGKFQHFKDRRPPWVKLYRDLLDDINWHMLDPVAAKVLVTLWLLASEDEKQEGTLPDIKTIAWRLRMTEHDVSKCISSLTHWLEQVDINVISDGNKPRYQDDAPETETEVETKKEKEEKAPRVRAAAPDPEKQSETKSKTLTAYLAECRAAKIKPVPDGHSIRRWAEDAGITKEMLQIAWLQFNERYTEAEKGKGKRYKDWPAHFATAVKGNWFKLWYTSDGGMQWSSTGLTHKQVLDARMEEMQHG